ncbi:hypothetical protein IKP85_01340 [bacterium]|nr:hypothetical protein [bacterium]
MAFTISSKNGEKTFSDKDLVNISSKPGYDFQIETAFPFMLTVHYDTKTGKCLLINQYRSQKFLFKGRPISSSLEIDKICKLMIDGSDDFLMIKVDGQARQAISSDAMTEDDIRAVYGNDVNAGAKLKLEQRKSELETARVAICKQISAPINDMRRKISMNSKGGILLHIALFFASLVCAFGVSNYLTGLPLADAGSVIQMPTNMKLIFIYALIVYGVGLVMKQGIYMLLQEKAGRTLESSNVAQKFMVVLSLAFYIAVYLINVLYYLGPKSLPFFAVFISLFFVGTALTLALGCGYFKSVNAITRAELNEYEYREDFEQVMREYQHWIEWFANNMSKTKLNNIKDRLFTLQLHSWGEILLGILTAPALAYGVSNTLAMCFPEAAGWIRISGLRLSPVFLVLATFLIIFAFFSFANAFTSNKKIQASNVLKQDGFSNYLTHGVDIYGLEAERKLDSDMRRSFIIGISIIVIEFSMNVSYFMQSIGGDLKGMLLSGVAALVPTALLIAETFMLSSTSFEKFASEELLAKIDRD